MLSRFRGLLAFGLGAAAMASSSLAASDTTCRAADASSTLPSEETALLSLWRRVEGDGGSPPRSLIHAAADEGLGLLRSEMEALEFSASGFAAAGLGSCAEKVGHGSIQTTGRDCRAMGGGADGSPGDAAWTECRLDWCRDGAYKAAAVGSCSAQVGSGSIRTSRGDCHTMGGIAHDVSGESSWTDCHLDWCRDGQYVAAQIQACGETTVVYAAIRATGLDCRAMGGVANGNPGDATWTDCHLAFMEGKPESLPG